MEISTIYHFSEPLVESVPQLFIMVFIIVNNLSGDAIAFDMFFKLSIISSLFSSAFALTKQLKVGPCQIMPRDKFGLTFILIFLSNVFGLLGKGFLLHVLVDYMHFLGFTSFYGPMTWLITFIVVPSILVSKLTTYHTLSLYFL